MFAKVLARMLLWMLALHPVTWLLLTNALAFHSNPHCIMTQDAPGQLTADCSYLNLTSIPKDLPSATIRLLLDHNHIHTLVSSDLEGLDLLQHLNLRNNSIPYLELDSFAELKALIYLDLKNKVMNVSSDTIPRGTFAPVRNLRVLKLGQGTVPGEALLDLPQLEELQIPLRADQSYVLPAELSYLPQLCTLNFAFGHVSAVTKSLLQGIKNSSIETLSFQGSQIKDVEPGAFTNFSSLQTINLACNDIHRGFDKVTTSMASLGSTPLDTLIMDSVNEQDDVTIIMPKNFCNDLGAKVRRLSIRSNKIIGMHLDVPPCLESLEVLTAGYYNYPTVIVPYKPSDYNISVQMFPPLLRTIDASHVFAVGAGFKDKYCTGPDMKSDDFFPRPLASYHLDKPPSRPVNYSAGPLVPPYVEHVVCDNVGLQEAWRKRYLFNPININNSLKVLEASHNQLVDSFPVTGNLWQLQVIDMSYNGLKTITEEAAASFGGYDLRHLNLSHNRLYEGQQDFEGTFHGLQKLVSLDLAHNGLSMMHPDAFLSNKKLENLLLGRNAFREHFSVQLSHISGLRCLDLSGNALRYLSSSLTSELEPFGAKLSLNITDNPLVCGCDSIDFIKWFKITNVTILKNRNISCSYENQSVILETVDLTILSLKCAEPDFSGTLRIVLMSVLLPVGLLLVAVGAAYRWRWYLRWHYYSIRYNFKRKRHALLEDDNDFQAYVIFNEEEDVPFIFRELRPQLEEEWRIRLFMNGRNDIPGTAKADSIVEGMGRCKYVLVVITPAFIKDEWCEFALHMALVKGINSLIILLKDEPDPSSMTTTLRGLLSPLSHVLKFELPEAEQGQRLVLREVADLIGPPEVTGELQCMPLI